MEYKIIKEQNKEKNVGVVVATCCYLLSPLCLGGLVREAFAQFVLRMFTFRMLFQNSHATGGHELLATDGTDDAEGSGIDFQLRAGGFLFCGLTGTSCGSLLRMGYECMREKE